MERFKKNLYQLLIEQRLSRYEEIEGMHINQPFYCYKDSMQFLIIIMKCLTYCEGSGVVINTERLKDELRLWAYYVNGKTNDEKLLYFGLIPLAMANQKTDDLNRTIRQYLDFFSIKVDKMPELLQYAYFIKASNSEPSIDDIYDKAKKHLIEFSYTDVFEDADKSRKIAFEKARILQFSRSIEDYWKYLCATGVWCDAADSSTMLDNNREWLQLLESLYNYLTGMGKGQVKAISYNKIDSKLYNQKPGNVMKHENFGDTVVLVNKKNEAGKTIIINTKYGCYKFNN
ncbi:MAG: hypothetical protein KMY55_15975 [Dethiosulfatibacter sp.]|nr:hypothetical protein [Dethiosulfatibacter sp.]